MYVGVGKKSSFTVLRTWVDTRMDSIEAGRVISAVSNAEVRTDDNDMMLVLDIFTPFGRDCNCRLSFRDKLIF